MSLRQILVVVLKLKLLDDRQERSQKFVFGGIKVFFFGGGGYTDIPPVATTLMTASRNGTNNVSVFVDML